MENIQTIKIFFIGTICLTMVFFVAEKTQAATYYMCNSSATCGSGWGNGRDDYSTTQAQNKSTPWLTLSRAYSQMVAGDTLIIGNGTYTGSANCTNVYESGGVPPSSGALWTTIQAENRGGVLFDGQSARNPFYYESSGSVENLHWVFDGLTWANSYPDSTVNVNHGSYVKFLNCGAYNTPSGNRVNFNVAHSSYILFEGCYAYGSGRYKFIGWQSDHLIFRNCIARNDAHNCQNEPIAAFSIYSVSHALVQNSIAIDSDLNDTQYANCGQYGGMFSVFDTDMASDDNTFTNCVAMNSTIGGMFIASNNPATNINYDNLAFLDIRTMTPYSSGNQGRQPLVRSRAVSGTFRNFTMASLEDNVVDGNDLMAADTGINNLYSSILTNSSVSSSRNILSGWTNLDHYNDYYDNNKNATLGEHDVTINPHWSVGTNPNGGLKYPVRIEPGSNMEGIGYEGSDIGANIIFQQGATGTIWGDAGYNLPQDGTNGQPVVEMWPFPNEELIQEKMGAYSDYGVNGERGFCSGNSLDGSPQTLTKYIWESLGNEIPCDIYGTCNNDLTAPAEPIGLVVR